MKVFFFVFIFLAAYVLATAQTNYSITYQTTTSDSDPGKFVPVLQTRLLIKDSLSYEYLLNDFDKPKSPYGKKFLGHSIFKNINSGLMIFQSHPLDNPKYLVKGTIPKIEWEISTEHKTILNHLCTKATCTYNNTIYIAWFAPAIPLRFGPDVFGDLPGLILELVSTKWQRVQTAVEIKEEPFEIVQPAHGKVITREKFEDIKRKLHAPKILSG